MTQRLAGKVAVITGATSGIGLATARLFAEHGATLFLNDLDRDNLTQVAAQLGARAIPGDISRMADLDALYDVVGTEAGGIDIVMANAGIAEFARVEDVTEELFDRIFSVNAKGTYFTVQKALPLLRSGAAVILTGSIAAVSGVPGMGVYTATKAAIHNYARGWTAELAPRGIRVNVVAPGIVDTPGLRVPGQTDNYDAMLDQMVSAVPLGRIGVPEDVAKVALFLASGDSGYLSGSVIFADGGMAQV
ncbi:SDR family NAD(P)-dependent oxidoreductase [Sphingobium boeckii]|uniref:NAD(P)-dependent dehydrogenase (Short-subunit alcohol dehydrogenase family) n=1 Tax=Sphingobium boeckii TaxID=1082345 RepID=A0A7W9AFP1_9SPHN|nr:SDR family oxidoreductase [Sphingobium boeckii]MBB5684818.1 NAD(P)-dependent dehydrogenase (short-subunit alcohol dehydrogenase family) [Sphingobium boeckii]